MKRVALLGVFLLGCYESHVTGGPRPRADGGIVDCGCIAGQRCCELCDGATVCVGATEPCPDVMCTDECTSNADCATDAYCAFEFGVCGGLGQCSPRPIGCFSDCPGACGCDGMTYCNRCEATRAGTSVLHDGACETTPLVCGMEICGPGDYCEQGGFCGEEGALFCVPRPTECLDIDEPTCGCDGRVYPNPCSVNMAGVSVTDFSRCEPSEDIVSTCEQICNFAATRCGEPTMGCVDACAMNLLDCDPVELSMARECASMVECGGGTECLLAISCVTGP